MGFREQGNMTIYFQGTTRDILNNFLGTRELLGYKRDLGSVDFLTTGKTFLMCKRGKGLSDDKILAKYYNFSHFSVIKEEKEAVCRGVSVL